MKGSVQADMTLYHYFRSSASYRVRIALGLKGLQAAMVPVNLLKAEQKSSAYTAVNPQGLVPSLVLEGGEVLTQSLAIMEYLEEVQPRPALLPAAPLERARVRALAYAVACDIAPLGNLGTQNYLSDTLKISAEEKAAWLHFWIGKGLTAIEALVAGSAYRGVFCHGDAPGLAECCLVPQLFSARRFGCDMGAFPTLVKIEEACAALPAFAQAHPAQQADAA